MKRARIPAAASCAMALLLVGCAGAHHEQRRNGIPIPHVMAAAGDSLTRAFNVASCCVFSDAPQYSWATGDNVAVNSHFQRLRRYNASLRVFNYARTGAKMSALEEQLREAALQRPDYVTVLMGGNDVLAIALRDEGACRLRLSAMTPLGTFRQQFRDALTAFVKIRPRAYLFVSSIPDIRGLWTLLSGNRAVERTWERFGLCARQLRGAFVGPIQRATDQRVRAYNAVLKSECAAIARCRSDGGRTYRTRFAAGDLSNVDFFHLSPEGQRRLAAITWQRSWWA